MNWDDIPVLLAVAETGSILAASRKLGCSHSTVVRRLDALEEILDTRLLRRHRQGCDLTPAGEQALVNAQQMQRALEDLQRGILGHRQELQGRLRIAVVDAAAGIVMPLLSRIRAAHPNLGFDLLFADRPVDLERGEADLALRLTLSPDDSLVGRCHGTVASAPYMHRNLLDLDPWDEAPWVVMHESMGPIPQYRWEQEHLQMDHAWLRLNSGVAVYDAVAGGLGCGVLTCVLGDSNPDLIRIGEADPALDLQLWTLYHRDLRHAARLRTVVDHLSNAMTMLRPLLRGEVEDSTEARDLLEQAQALPLG